MTDQKKKTVLFSVLAVICAVASLALIVFSMLTPGIRYLAVGLAAGVIGMVFSRLAAGSAKKQSE
jgi:membrane protein implicated in regulation of membrane protease activity